MKKNIIIGVLIFIIVILLLGFLFYKNINKTVTVEGNVLYVGNDYVIVKDKEDNEYSIPTDREYSVGDKIGVVLKNINYDVSPIEGEVVNIYDISKNVSFSDESNSNTSDESNSNTHSDVNESVSENNVDSHSEEIISSNNDVDSSSEEVVGTDEDVVSYFQDIDKKLTQVEKDSSVSKSLKEGFITIVDFLFYGGTIKGRTFKDLSDTAKIKVLKIFFSIDSQIEKHFPNYKEELSERGNHIYTNLKEKALELYLNTTDKICSSNEELCKNATEGLSDLKKSFSFTWSFIKDIAGVSGTKLKRWYEIWRSAS